MCVLVTLGGSSAIGFDFAVFALLRSDDRSKVSAPADKVK